MSILTVVCRAGDVNISKETDFTPYDRAICISFVLTLNFIAASLRSTQTSTLKTKANIWPIIHNDLETLQDIERS